MAGGWRERPGQPSPYSHAPSRSLNELEAGGRVANALSLPFSHTHPTRLDVYIASDASPGIAHTSGVSVTYGVAPNLLTVIKPVILVRI